MAGTTWARSPEEWLLRDPTLQRPGPLQTDWVRRGIPRGGDPRRKGTLGETAPAGFGTAAPGAIPGGGSASASSPPRPSAKLTRMSTAPGAINLPKASLHSQSPKKVSPKGTSQAVGLSLPSDSGKSGKPVRAIKKMPVGGGTGASGASGTSASTGNLGTSGVMSPGKGKISARSGTSTASTALPGGATPASASPPPSSRASFFLKKTLEAKRGKGGGKGAEVSAAPSSETAARESSTEKKEGEGESSPKSAAPFKRESNKAWVMLEGPSGETTKVRLKIRLSVNDLRKAVSAKTAVPLKDLQLRVGDRILDQARRPAFESMSQEEIGKTVVNWWRSDRLKMVMDKRKLADHTSRGWLGRTVLHYCVLDGDFTLCLEVCNQEYAPELINVQDILGDTALMFASICGFDDIVDLLLDRQAEPDHMNLTGRNALMLAAEHGHHKTEKSLLNGCARRGPNHGFRRPDEVYLAELNGQDKVLSAIRVFELSEAVVADLGF